MIPTKKKIAVLHPEVSTQWWAVTMMLYLAWLLAEKWNEVVFFTTKYTKENFEVHKKITFFVWSKIQILFQLRNFDYIFIWNSPMHFVWVSAKILHFSKTKLFWWHHHYPWYYNKNANFYVFLKKILEKFSLLFIDEILVNSVYLQKAIQQLYKKDSKILYPVVDKIFLNTNKNKITKKTKTTLFTYGRWVEWKNLKQILKTYDDIKHRFSRLDLYIAWVGKELEVFQEKYKNDNNVHFVWFLDKIQLVQYLQKTRVFLFPSRIDSFWMSAAEAISMGVPVIWFIWKWLSEIVQNNKNWCTVESEQDFTKKTLELLQNDIIYEQMQKFIHNCPNKFSDIYFTEQLDKIF